MMRQQRPVGVKIFDVPARMTADRTNTMLSPIKELNVQISRAIEANDRSDISINLDQHPQPSKFDASVSVHGIDKLLFF
jgi:hypothetical protein